MFVFNRWATETGTFNYENEATPNVSSGLKVYDSPEYITGTVRFVVAKRINKVIPTQEGRMKVEELTTQFGWDEISGMQQSGLYLEPGRLKLTYDDVTFRLVDKNNFGQPYNRNYRPIGLIEAKFQREVSRIAD